MPSRPRSPSWFSVPPWISKPHKVEAVGAERDLVFQQCPGRWSAEETEQHDPQQHVFWSHALTGVDDVADQILGNAVARPVGVAESVPAEHAVVRPRRRV